MDIMSSRENRYKATEYVQFRESKIGTDADKMEKFRDAMSCRLASSLTRHLAGLYSVSALNLIQS